MYKKYGKLKMNEEQKAISKDTIRKTIEFFGTSANLARVVKLSPAAISRWLNNKTTPSMSTALKIHKATKGKIKKEDIRPDIFW